MARQPSHSRIQQEYQAAESTALNSTAEALAPARHQGDSSGAASGEREQPGQRRTEEPQAGESSASKRRNATAASTEDDPKLRELGELKAKSKMISKKVQIAQLKAEKALLADKLQEFTTKATRKGKGRHGAAEKLTSGAEEAEDEGEGEGADA